MGSTSVDILGKDTNGIVDTNSIVDSNGIVDSKDKKYILFSLLPCYS